MESVEASFRSYLYPLQQFAGIFVALMKQVYLYIACAASLIIWNMPFGCLLVICEESNVVISYKLLSTKKDSVPAVPFSSPSERKKHQNLKEIQIKKDHHREKNSNKTLSISWGKLKEE